MGYNISDLVQKLIEIEKASLELYISIEEKSKDKFQSIAIVTRAIAKQEKKHVEYYEKLKKDLEEGLNEDIDIFLYDKVVKLLYEFKKHLELPTIDEVQELIKFSLNFERNNIALLLDIQGRLLEKKDDINNNVYIVISKIINEEHKHEKMFGELIISKE